MHVSLLGPLLVDGTGGEILLPAAKERAVLAALALRPGSVVSTASLMGALWGDEPPATARKTLQNYVSRLRQALGADAITTEGAGYALQIDPDEVDVFRFRSLVRAGERTLREGAASRARAELAAAVALWRGEPFADLPPDTQLANEAVRLKEELLSALEARITADLEDGGHAELVGELEALVGEHPYREKLWGHLMVALYRCGRQADALAAFQRARKLLVSELGLEPGGDLLRLEAAVLGHDPRLAEPTQPPDPRSEPIIRSPVRYARSSDGVGIAYQVAGDGPIDILAVPGFVSHLDIWWNAPTDRLVRRLTSIGRLISFDKRGMGLSDRPETVDADQWVDDAAAVLDAVGSRSAVVLGVSAGVPTALRLAARHPERVQALVLQGGYARALAAADYDVGWDRSAIEAFAQNLEAGWGTGVAISSYAPSRAKDTGVREYWARYQLLSASPAAAMRYFWALIEADVRDVLETTAVPTLVVHAERDVVVPLAQARYMAERIPSAELVTLDSDVHLICVSDRIEELTGEIEAFIRRAVPAAQVEAVLVTALAVHTPTAHGRREVEEIVERCGGHMQRPPVTATFDRPGRAVRAATSLVSELGARGHEVRVGLHVAESLPTAFGYRGPAVDVAHRLAGAAGLGEVLLTQTVRDLLADTSLRLEARPDLPDPGGHGGWEVFATTPEPVASSPTS